MDFLILNCNRDFANKNDVPQTAIFILGISFGIMNGFSRLLCSYLMNKFGFRILMLVITTIEIIVGTLLFFEVNSAPIFVIFVSLIGACIGGNFVIIALTFNKIFGLKIGLELYGISSISIGIANISGPILTTFIVEENKDYFVAFIIGASLSICKLIFLLFFKEEPFSIQD